MGTRVRSTPIRSKKIKKKSYFTCTLEYDQPPSDRNPIKKNQKKIIFHLYTRVRSTPIRSKSDQNLIKKNRKKIKFHLYTRVQSPPIRSKSDQKKSKKKSNFT